MQDCAVHLPDELRLQKSVFTLRKTSLIIAGDVDVHCSKSELVAPQNFRNFPFKTDTNEAQNVLNFKDRVVALLPSIACSNDLRNETLEK